MFDILSRMIDDFNKGFNSVDVEKVKEDNEKRRLEAKKRLKERLEKKGYYFKKENENNK